jgi:hypothetical protein
MSIRAKVVAPAVLACVVSACGLLPAAAPALGALTVCVYQYVRTNPGLTLLEYVSRAFLSCGGDALSILDALISSDSSNPATAALKAEAQALKAKGGEALSMFVGSVNARVGALRAGAK